MDTDGPEDPDIHAESTRTQLKNILMASETLSRSRFKQMGQILNTKYGKIKKHTFWYD